MNEVLCIPKFRVDKFIASTTDHIDICCEAHAKVLVESITTPGRSVLLPRADVETNDYYLQIIPYTLLMKDDAYCVYRRTNASGESRLSKYYSIGFGGHINHAVRHYNDILKSASRELYEEAGLIAAQNLYRLVGAISGGDAVGTVHLGLILIYTLLDHESVKETQEGHCVDFQFRTVSELSQYEDSLEPWSKAILERKLKNLDSRGILWM